MLGAIIFATNGYMQIGERARFVSGTDNLLVATGLGIATAGSLGGLFCATAEFFLKFTTAANAPNQPQTPSQPIKPPVQPRSADDEKFAFDPTRFGKKVPKGIKNTTNEGGNAKSGIEEAAKLAAEAFARKDFREKGIRLSDGTKDQRQLFLLAMDETNKHVSHDKKITVLGDVGIDPNYEKFREDIRQELAKIGAEISNKTSSSNSEPDMSQWSWLPATARTERWS